MSPLLESHIARHPLGSPTDIAARSGRVREFVMSADAAIVGALDDEPAGGGRVHGCGGTMGAVLRQ